MTDDLITRMAEAAYERRMEVWRRFVAYRPVHEWAETTPEFRAEIIAEMEMLRDMVHEEARRARATERAAADARCTVRKQRLSLF